MVSLTLFGWIQHRLCGSTVAIYWAAIWQRIVILRHSRHQTLCSATGRLLNGVNIVGNFHQAVIQRHSQHHRVVLRCLTEPETTAWVIAGRSVWANVEIQTASGVTGNACANNTNGVTHCRQQLLYLSRCFGHGDLNNDGFVEIAMSGGTIKDFVHVVEGAQTSGSTRYG